MSNVAAWRKLQESQWRGLYAGERLLPHHRDPFDRLVVAQAQLDNLTLLTAGSQLASYDIATTRI